MSNRLNKEREALLQPERLEHAIKEIENLGYTITQRTNTSITFGYMDAYVTFFPYSGWHSGKSIKDGRGLQNLLNQIKTK